MADWLWVVTALALGKAYVNFYKMKLFLLCFYSTNNKKNLIVFKSFESWGKSMFWIKRKCSVAKGVCEE